MPFGYLFTTLLVAWCAFFAVAAPRRPRPLARASFWFGMVLSEIPHAGIVLLGASTLLAAAEGDLDTTAGRIVAALAVAAMAALLVPLWQGIRVPAVVRRALAEAFGDGAGGTRSRRTRPWLRILLLPVARWKWGVLRIRDIAYGPAGRRHRLDVYRRPGAPAGAPVLVHFHGGQYRAGAKSRESRAMLYRLASLGWVCVSANYRLSPQVSFPEHQIDGKRVIAWIREHGHEYGADASRLFVAGSSAGANIAGLCAFTPNDPAFQPGFEDADTSVTGAVLLYGYYGHHFGAAPAGPPPPMQPQGYVHADAPPLFVAHGTNDSWGTVEAARDFAAKARRVMSAPVVYVELPGAQHTFDLAHSARFEAVVDGVEAFANRVLAPPA